jgi:ATP-dependent RNA helicase DeaD
MTTTTTTSEPPQGTDSPEDPTFDALPLSAEVRSALDEIGWSQPTPVQLAAYEPTVEGKDLIVQARTGTGKTAAFGLPIIDRMVRNAPHVQFLVLAPTRELALQSQRELERIGKHKDVKVAAVYGGAPMDKQIKQLKEGAQVVSGTPGRVLDHLRRGTLDPSHLRMLVLDEADEILSMGFLKELHAIMELLPANRQTLLFSATAEGEVSRVAERYMHEPEYLSLSGDAVGASGISHYIYLVGGTGRIRDLTRILETEDPESAIIFCNTRAETERVASELQQNGFNADWINGDLPQADREKLMDRTRKGELRYLVATDVAARGIDISHLSHVINHQFPDAPEQYIHRTGRTGRAGRTGTAISLVSPQELGTLYFLRLQYKIFPVERSLPTAGEQKTRKEVDRLAMLEQAFTSKPGEMDRSLARRLLTHPNAERLLAGLLRTFFGQDASEVDEQAAAARRSRNPPPAPAQAKEERRESGGRKRRRQSKGTDENSDRTGNGEAASRADGPNGSEESTATLYINIGRRDGVRPGEVSRLLQEQAGLDRDDIGRIRIRDKHTFVGIPSAQVDGVVSQLSGQNVRDRELVVELAKTRK